MGTGWLESLKSKIRKAFGGTVILCDTCMWDWRSACHNPDRPNATSCSEYKKRGS